MSGVQITGLIKPLNAGSFPVFEDSNGLGGLRSVADSAARDAIPDNFRKIGMVVTLQDTGAAWELVGGITNGDWVAFGGGGSGQGQIVVADLTALAAVDASALAAGTTAQVANFDDYELVTPGFSVAADGLTLVAATGGGYWSRKNVRASVNEQLNTLYVNGSTGSDSSPNPSDSGTPLKTLNEAFARLSRLTVGTVDISIFVASSPGPQSVDFDLTGIVSVPINVNVYGEIVVDATQAITSYVAPDAATNTRGTVTFPAAGYAFNTPLKYFDAFSWVNLHPSANVNNCANFFGQDGTISNPSGGENVSAAHFSTVLLNVNARIPVGFTVNFFNCEVQGTVNGDGAANSLVFNQCLLSGGLRGGGSVHLVNCSVNQTTADAFYCLRVSDCTFYGTIGLFGAGNVLFDGSLTSTAPLYVADSTVRVGDFSARSEFAFYNVIAFAACVVLTGKSSLNLGSMIVFGSGNGVNANFTIDAGGEVYCNSATPPSVTGGSHDIQFGGGIRLCSFDELPVSCPRIPASFTFSDTAQGEGDASVAQFGRTGNVGVTNLFNTTPRTGLYEISGYIVPTILGTTGTLTLNAHWVDDSAVAQTKVIATYPSIAAATGGQGGSVTIEQGPGNFPIQYSVTGIVTPGALHYNFRVVGKLLSDG